MRINYTPQELTRSDLIAAVERVRALHVRDQPAVDDDVDYCADCGGIWPCDTIRALDGGDV